MADLPRPREEDMWTRCISRGYLGVRCKSGGVRRRNTPRSPVSVHSVLGSQAVVAAPMEVYLQVHLT